ncbi:cardiolipin synthase [Flavilitoribacter nigricans]|uniref:Cardiolipin synthase n=1 Tax=Flavilitoribacter nigricans (strain ATCC 23147 / DSM 23189 / NBRC 102662 / NCIMB 1420 / SS-2) TaxID=1122177 RepID=A0A2D0NGZ3_FLAN2|nr:cardiolipin synthase [Flavilitoribacter nigricans]PHN07033.1 cardiolipin synthase [Flavilitoribacter nigricans DSM 23189 = NBRC 102662]
MDWVIISEIVYALLLIGVGMRVLFDTRSSVKASAYLLLIVLLPLIGIIIYLSVGLNYRKYKIYSKKLMTDREQAKNLLEAIHKLKEENADLFAQQFEAYSGIAEMVFSDNLSLLTRHNRVEVLINGEKKFPSLLESLEQATHHIHIAYYIYENDRIGNQVAELLMRKAAEGVQVRFIYDDFGSSGIRNNLVLKLRESGVEVHPFYEVRFVKLANRLNYRNHRKIVVIDGTTAFVGGINICDKYRNDVGNELFWRDTHLKITGEAVWTLQHIFIADWNFCSGQKLELNTRFFLRFFPRFTADDYPEKTWTQIIASGPDSPHPSILYSYLQAIHLARKELMITTPYFIPGQEFLSALKMAALRGVKVQLLVPGVADSQFVNAASKSHYEDLLAVGVEIYLYEKGFVHAKTLVCDDQLSVVGTANLDHRSFDLNFEVNAMVFDEQITAALKNAFMEDLAVSRRITLENWQERSFVIQFIEKLIRLFAPLL